MYTGICIKIKKSSFVSVNRKNGIILKIMTENMEFHLKEY